MRRLARSHEECSIADAWDWFGALRVSLRRQEESVRQALGAGAGEAVPDCFADLTEQELGERFRALHDELAKMACLDILAAAEAAISIDFRLRAETKTPRDDLTVAYRQTWRRVQRRSRPRTRLEEDVLESILLVTQDRKTRAAISAFRGALRLRHWLAHGRYWRPKLGRMYDPQSVYDISYDLLSALDLLADVAPS